MKAFSVIVILLLLLANAAALLLTLQLLPMPALLATALSTPQAMAAGMTPAVIALLPYVLIATLALGLTAVVAVGSVPTAPAETDTLLAEALRPAPLPPRLENQAEAEVVAFLGLLQSKGRLVDFLMDNINAYSDAQVGAAARVVHAGCKSVLDEHFRIAAIRAEKEQSQVEVPDGYAADEYRLLGKISGQAPFTGALVHHGWKTDFVKLPTILRGAPDRLPAIAPAEVELK